MNDIEKSHNRAAEVAKEAIRIAEEKGLTLYEVLSVPDLMKNRIMNGLRTNKDPYKWEDPFKQEKPAT